MDNPNVGIFDTVMNAVWVSCDKKAAQFRYVRIANPDMRSFGDEFVGIQERPTYSVGGSRTVFGYVFQNVPEVVTSAPPGLSSAAISSADTNSPRLT